MARAVRRLSPVIITVSNAMRLQPGNCCGRRPFSALSAMASNPSADAIAARPTTVCALASSASMSASQLVQCDALLAQQPRTADRRHALLEPRSRALAGKADEIFAPSPASVPFSCGGGKIACASGCSDSASTLAARRKQLVVRDACVRHQPLDAGPAFRQRAGFVEQHDVDAPCPRSSASPSLMRMPRRAPSPVPTMIAVGVQGRARRDRQ